MKLIIDIDKEKFERLKRLDKSCFSPLERYILNGKPIDNAPTVDTYTDEDIKQAIKENFEIGYEMAKAKFERKTGEWIKGKDSCSHFFFCSECKCGIQSDWDIIVNFCPECGADMRVKNELGGRK